MLVRALKEGQGGLVDLRSASFMPTAAADFAATARCILFLHNSFRLLN